MWFKGISVLGLILVVSVALVGCGRESKKPASSEEDGGSERTARAERGGRGREAAATDAVKQKVVGDWVAKVGTNKPGELYSRMLLEIKADGKMKLTNTMSNPFDGDRIIESTSEGAWDTEGEGIVILLWRSLDGRPIPEDQRELKATPASKTGPDGAAVDYLKASNSKGQALEFMPATAADRGPLRPGASAPGAGEATAPTPVRQRPGARPAGAGNEAGRSEVREGIVSGTPAHRFLTSAALMGLGNEGSWSACPRERGHGARRFGMGAERGRSTGGQAASGTRKRC